MPPPKQLFDDPAAQDPLGYVCAAPPYTAAGPDKRENLTPQIYGMLLLPMRKEMITSGRPAGPPDRPRYTS